MGCGCAGVSGFLRWRPAPLPAPLASALSSGDLRVFHRIGRAVAAGVGARTVAAEGWFLLHGQPLAQTFLAAYLSLAAQAPLAHNTRQVHDQARVQVGWPTGTGAQVDQPLSRHDDVHVVRVPEDGHGSPASAHYSHPPPSPPPALFPPPPSHTP